MGTSEEELHAYADALEMLDNGGGHKPRFEASVFIRHIAARLFLGPYCVWTFALPFLKTANRNKRRRADLEAKGVLPSITRVPRDRQGYGTPLLPRERRPPPAWTGPCWLRNEEHITRSWIVPWVSVWALIIYSWVAFAQSCSLAAAENAGCYVTNSEMLAPTIMYIVHLTITAHMHASEQVGKQSTAINDDTASAAAASAPAPAPAAVPATAPSSRSPQMQRQYSGGRRSTASSSPYERVPMGEGNDPAGDANEGLLQECETTAFADGMVFEASSAFLLAKCCQYPTVLEDQTLLLQPKSFGGGGGGGGCGSASAPDVPDSGPFVVAHVDWFWHSQLFGCLDGLRRRVSSWWREGQWCSTTLDSEVELDLYDAASTGDIPKIKQLLRAHGTRGTKRLTRIALEEAVKYAEKQEPPQDRAGRLLRRHAGLGPDEKPDFYILPTSEDTYCCCPGAGVGAGTDAKGAWCSTCGRLTEDWRPVSKFMPTGSIWPQRCVEVWLEKPVKQNVCAIKIESKVVTHTPEFAGWVWDCRLNSKFAATRAIVCISFALLAALMPSLYRVVWLDGVCADEPAALRYDIAVKANASCQEAVDAAVKAGELTSCRVYDDDLRARAEAGELGNSSALCVPTSFERLPVRDVLLGGTSFFHASIVVTMGWCSFWIYRSLLLKLSNVLHAFRKRRTVLFITTNWLQRSAPRHAKDWWAHRLRVRRPASAGACAGSEVASEADGESDGAGLQEAVALRELPWTDDRVVRCWWFLRQALLEFSNRECYYYHIPLGWILLCDVVLCTVGLVRAFTHDVAVFHTNSVLAIYYSFVLLVYLVVTLYCAAEANSKQRGQQRRLANQHLGQHLRSAGAPAPQRERGRETMRCIGRCMEMETHDKSKCATIFGMNADFGAAASLTFGLFGSVASQLVVLFDRAELPTVTYTDINGSGPDRMQMLLRFVASAVTLLIILATYLFTR